MIQTEDRKWSKLERPACLYCWYAEALLQSIYSLYWKASYDISSLIQNLGCDEDTMGRGWGGGAPAEKCFMRQGVLHKLIHKNNSELKSNLTIKCDLGTLCSWL